MKVRHTIAVVVIAAGAYTANSVAPSRAAGLPQTAVTLRGSLPGVVTSGQASLVGAHNLHDPINLAVCLRLRNVALLQAFLTSIGDRKSPHFHQSLTQLQANNLFNPTLAAESQVTSWLRGGGVTVTRRFPNHLLIDVRGTVSVVQALFHVTINDYTVSTPSGRVTFFSPDRDPSVPSTLVPYITGIVGLSDVPHAAKRTDFFTDGTAKGTPPFYPQDIANEYDINPLWNAGDTGTSQHAAVILNEVPPADSMLQGTSTAPGWGYTTGASVPTRANHRLNIVSVDGGTTCPPTAESGIDIEAEATAAPNLAVDYYELPNGSNPCGLGTESGVDDALNMAGTSSSNDLAISSSWGDCESSWTQTFINTTEAIFQSNSATGHTYLFAAGDQQAACPGSNVTEPIYPASSAWVLAVGGTMLSVAGGGIGSSYAGESAWACNSDPPCNLDLGTGGGYSNLFSEPAYQMGLATDFSATAGACATHPCRGYADVSALATGLYICSNICGGVAGTSWSTPFWAGVLTVINQYLAGRHEPTMGFVTPSLYGLSDWSLQYPVYAAFHDITLGANPTYQTAPGWDPLTGLGTPDVWNLARDVPGTIPYEAEAYSTASPPPPTFYTSLQNGAYVTSCIPCSNGEGVAGINANDASLTFHNFNVGSDGYYTVTIYYQNTVFSASSLCTESATLAVNSSGQGSGGVGVCFPFTDNNSVSSVAVVVHLQAGNNLLSLYNTYSAAPTIDELTISRRTGSYEVEDLVDNTLTGTSSVASCSACSGGSKVAGLGNGSTLTFNNVQAQTGHYQIAISYTNGSGAAESATVNVDGGDCVQTPSFPATASSNTVGVVYVTFSGGCIIWGGNTSVQISNPTAKAPDIDKIDVSPAPPLVVEAENLTQSTLGGSASVVSCSCVGSEGVGNLGYNAATGQTGTLTTTVGAITSPGYYTLAVRYLNPDSTPREATVGGSMVTFWPTGNSSKTILVSARMDTSGNVMIYNNSGVAPIIDDFTLYY